MKERFPQTIWVWVSKDKDEEFLIPCETQGQLPDHECRVATYQLVEVGNLEISKTITLPKTKK